MLERRTGRAAVVALAIGALLPGLGRAAEAEPDSTARPPEPPRPRPTMHAPT